MNIWILMSGERNEGGQVLGVYANREAALGAFREEVLDHNRTWKINEATEHEDGGLYIEIGCDWVSLEPHGVVGNLQIGA